MKFNPRRRRRRLWALLALLLLLAAMLPLGSFLAGYLSGGGRRPDTAVARSGRSPGTGLEVTVRSARDGGPVHGARIVVEGLLGGASEATSDASGRATLKDLGKSPVRIEARYAGGAASAWAHPALGRPVELSVDPRPVRSGRVRGADGSPVQAVVRLLDAEGRALATAATDGEGAYELPDLPDAVAVCAQPARGAPASVARGDLVVGEGVTLEGRLLGAGPGRCEIHGELPAPGADALLPVRFTWETGSDGSFRGTVPAGLRAYGIFDGLPFRLAAGEIRLPERTGVRGRVVRADGTPAAGARLVFRPLLDEDFAVPLPPTEVSADDRGDFEEPAVARMRYTVLVTAPGCAARVLADVLAGPEPIAIRMERGFRVTGYVLDDAGLPLGNARVQAVGQSGDAGDLPILEERADGKGRFLVDGLAGASARLRVSAPGHHPTTLEVAAGAGDLRIILQPR